MTLEQNIRAILECNFTGYKDEIIDIATKNIMSLSDIENQKTGHWIRWYEEVEHKTCTENIPHCKCSECNKEYNPYSSFFIKYCSQCGAKMEGESNAE